MERKFELARCGVAIAVGEIKWTDEEARKQFTDSEGRVHSVVFIDPDTGERRFGCKPIRCRSGLLVSKSEHVKPTITVLKNEKITIHNLD